MCPHCTEPTFFNDETCKPEYLYEMVDTPGTWSCEENAQKFKNRKRCRFTCASNGKETKGFSSCFTSRKNKKYGKGWILSKFGFNRC